MKPVLLRVALLFLPIVLFSKRISNNRGRTIFARSHVMIISLAVLLAACAATPEIRTRKAGMSMELSRQAYWVTSAAYSRDGRHVLAGGHDKILRLWDVSTGKVVGKFVGHSQTIDSVALSPDGRYALSGGLDSTVRLWDIETGKELRVFRGHSSSVQSVVFSPDGSHALSASLDSTVTLWNIKTGKAVQTFSRHGGFVSRGVLSLAFSPDGRHAVSGGVDGKIKLWEVATGREVRTLAGHSGLTEGGWVRSLAFSPNGRYVLSGGGGRFMKLWEIETGKLVQTFPGTSSVMGGVLSVAFSPDGRHVVAGGDAWDSTITLWDIATGREIRSFTGHHASLSGGAFTVLFSSDGKFLLSGGGDASIRRWKTATGEEVAMMVGFENGEWIAITPEGYYNASPNGDQYLNVLMGKDKYTSDQFYDVFYRPDIVAAKLRGEDISGLVTITMQDAIKSPPPTVAFTSKLSDTDQPKAKVCYRARSTGGGIGEVRLFHNGKLIQSDGYYREAAKSATDEKMQLASLNSRAIYDDMRNLTIKARSDSALTTTRPKGDLFEDCREIETIPGENELSVSAFNSSNTVQSYMKTIRFNSSVRTEDPHLYILSVGIDRYKDNTVNLKYAVKDAKDIENKLKTQAATLYNPGKIYYFILTDEEATKAKITEKINNLATRIKPQDGFILFVAGHGVLLQNQYYMLTHDFNGRVSDTDMISSNEIVEASKKIKSLSQLFIFDTCHAGGVDTIVSGLYDARMSVLAKKMGLHIYASASDKQTAMDGYRGNGLFTYTLLDGLNNNRAADKNKDGKVSVVGLGSYSKERTTTISKEIGHSQTPLIINFGKDYPIYQLR